jgi:hypothetical protein
MIRALPHETTVFLEGLLRRFPRSVRLRLKWQHAKRREEAIGARARAAVMARIKDGLAEADMGLLEKVAELLEAGR